MKNLFKDFDKTRFEVIEKNFTSINELTDYIQNNLRHRRFCGYRYVSSTGDAYILLYKEVLS